MKRTSYVDSQGNTIDHSFESKKTILRLFIIIGTIVPLVIIGFIIYTVIQNNKCIKIYDYVKSASAKYLKEKDKLPTVEGESTTFSVSKLYDGYLSTYYTNNMKCSGNVKVTRYKKEYIYTLNLTNCDVCSTNVRYKGWSSEVAYKPNKSNIDVIPYYNFYEREVNVTGWSDYIPPEDLSTKKSKYGFALPKDKEKLPDLPKEGSVVEIQKDEKTEYRYKDREWLWYNIVGNYSAFSSEQPAGFANKDEDTEIYTEWSNYSLEYPAEKDYRDIVYTTGYIYFYEKNGKKIYANHKKYTAEEEIDSDKYDQREEQTAKMYRYRDKQWRWYNGTKREYTSYNSEQPEGYPYRDNDTIIETSYSNWDSQSYLTTANKYYRVEESRIVTRFRYQYEILSAPVYDAPVSKEKLLSDIDMTVPEFNKLEEYKLEFSYKFKYQMR